MILFKFTIKLYLFEKNCKLSNELGLLVGISVSEYLFWQMNLNDNISLDVFLDIFKSNFKANVLFSFHILNRNQQKW